MTHVLRISYPCLKDNSCIDTSWQIKTIVVLPKVEKSKCTQPVVEMDQYNVTFKEIPWAIGVSLAKYQSTPVDENHDRKF